MDYETLLYETEGELGILTYNRPELVNAVNRQMLEELTHFWEERQEDFDTRVIIIKGAGEKGFNSGLDLKDAMDTEKGFAEGGLTPENVYNNQTRFSKVIRLMRTCPQSIIAAVHGYAMGAGLSFAMAADIRLASPDAVFCAQGNDIQMELEVMVMSSKNGSHYLDFSTHEDERNALKKSQNQEIVSSQ